MKLTSVIEKRIFGNAKPSEKPKFYFVGGQSGSGKTATVNTLKHEHNLVYINPDKMRIYHPKYKDIVMEGNELELANITADFSRQITQEAIDYAIKHEISFILEGTFKRFSYVRNTLQKFKETNFKVNVVALCVPTEMAITASVLRYYKSPSKNRWVDLATHQDSNKNAEITYKKIINAKLANYFTIMTRDGIKTVYYIKEYNSNIKNEILEEVKYYRDVKQLESPALKSLLEEYDEVKQLAKDNPNHKDLSNMVKYLAELTDIERDLKNYE
ncbi:MAG: zeta toxin family protein [Micrococcaceae bacterium]